MQLIKYTHACVRLEHDGHALVIDPGTWSEPAALDGATAVLVTHEHFDHVDTDRLTAAVAADPALRVYTHAAVAEQLKGLGDAVVTIASGDEFEAAGFPVRAVGGDHAEIYEGLPGIPNVGFVIDTGDAEGGLYHPGDAFFVPDVAVSTLLVPASGPWFKLAEALDFVRAAAPRRAYPIHDALLNQIGEQLFDRWLDMKGNTEYARIPIGEPVSLDRR
jgi:L-ascorbate metabolism protein UlaG (beta-lactamase superfamily)